MVALKPSVKKQVTDWLVARLRGDGSLSLPSGMPDFTVDKDRRNTAVAKTKALVSVYALRQNEPDRAGPIRRPTLLTRSLQLEVRVLLQGDDDVMDQFEQWITYCLGTADQIETDDFPRGMVLSVREAESANMLLKDSDGNVLVYQSRWTIEYTTLPDDLTYTGRLPDDIANSQRNRA